MISVEEFLQGRHLPDASFGDDDHNSTDANSVAEAAQSDKNAAVPDSDMGAADVGSAEAVAGSVVSDSRASIDDVAASARNRKSARLGRPNKAHTHAESVTSNYTSGFGGSLDDEETFNSRSGRRKYGKYGRRRGGTHYRKYRTGAPTKRVPDDPADMDACREAALTLLDAAARSSGALVKRLVDKGYDPVVADDVVTRLIDVRLIDDEGYARSVVRSCAVRMLGFRGTVMELKRKDIDDQLAQQVASEAREQGVFEDAAWRLGRKVAAKTEGLDLQVRRRRFWSAGGRKGHDSEILRRVAHELFTASSEV